MIKMKILVYLAIRKNSLDKCAKNEYFAHFCTGFIFCTFFEAKYF